MNTKTPISLTIQELASESYHVVTSLVLVITLGLNFQLPHGANLVKQTVLYL